MDSRLSLRKGVFVLYCISMFSARVLPLSTLSLLANSSSVQLITQNETEENQIIYHVMVDCEELEPREAKIRAYHNLDSNGTVIFVSGGWGKGWYSYSGEAAQTVDSMNENGYETFEIRWLGEQGWGSNNSGKGFKRLSCGFSELVQWIVTNIANNPQIVGVTGHSGGSNEISYGLALHNLESIFDVIVLTGGPARSNLVDLCKVNSSGVNAIIDYVMGWQGDVEYCQSCQFPEWVTNALYSESIVSPLADEDRDFNYSSTKLVFVEGEHDIYAPVGKYFYDIVLCEKSWIELTGVGHGIPSDPDGAQLIRMTLLDGLKGVSENIEQIPESELGIFVNSPINEAELEILPIIINVTIVSNDSYVPDVSVKFYVDDVFSGVVDSNNNGFASLSLDVSEGSHNWYAFAEKTGYKNATSSTFNFSYEELEPEPETTSGIPGFPTESLILSILLASVMMWMTKKKN